MSGQLKSDIDQLKDDLTRQHIQTGDQLSSVKSTVASLLKRVELIDTRFERVSVTIFLITEYTFFLPLGQRFTQLDDESHGKGENGK